MFNLGMGVTVLDKYLPLSYLVGMFKVTEESV